MLTRPKPIEPVHIDLMMRCRLNVYYLRAVSVLQSDLPAGTKSPRPCPQRFDRYADSFAHPAGSWPQNYLPQKHDIYSVRRHDGDVHLPENDEHPCPCLW